MQIRGRAGPRWLSAVRRCPGRCMCLATLLRAGAAPRGLPSCPGRGQGAGGVFLRLSVQLWGKCAPFLTSPAWPLQRLRSEGASWLKWAVHSDLNSRLWLEPGATCENAAERPPLETEASLLPPEAALLLGTRPRSLPWDGRFTAGRGHACPWETQVPAV